MDPLGAIYCLGHMQVGGKRTNEISIIAREALFRNQKVHYLLRSNADGFVQIRIEAHRDVGAT